LSTTLQSSEERLADGALVKVHLLRGSELTPVRLRGQAIWRAREGAGLLSHISGVASTALALPSAALRLADGPARWHEDDHGIYPTVRSALLAYLQRRREGEARDPEIARFIRKLQRRGSVALSGEAARLPTPIGSMGSLRQLASLRPEPFLLNTPFFLLDPRELDAPQAALGDVAGMLASGGRILNPPTVPRATLLRDASGWRIAILSIDDLALTLAGGVTFRPGEAGVSWRYRGDGAPGPHPSALDLVVQGHTVTALHPKGGAVVPHGAVLLAFESAPSASLLRELQRAPNVRWGLPNHPTVHRAIGAGPLLIHEGRLVITKDSLPTERFFTLGSPDPTAPLVFPADHHSTRAGRIGVGVNAAGELLVVSVEGRSRLGAADSSPPSGATLLELAELLLAAGAKSAMNLDGGGSAQMFRGGGAIHSSSDRRGQAGVQFDRPVPLAAQLS